MNYQDTVLWRVMKFDRVPQSFHTKTIWKYTEPVHPVITNHPVLCQKNVMTHCESETNIHTSITCQCWHYNQYTQIGSNISHMSYECVGACNAVTAHLSVTQTKQCPPRTHNPAQLFSVPWFHLQEHHTRYTTLQQQNSHMTH
jgi:hypothetical protein